MKKHSQVFYHTGKVGVWGRDAILMHQILPNVSHEDEFNMIHREECLLTFHFSSINYNLPDNIWGGMPLRVLTKPAWVNLNSSGHLCSHKLWQNLFVGRKEINSYSENGKSNSNICPGLDFVIFVECQNSFLLCQHLPLSFQDNINFIHWWLNNYYTRLKIYVILIILRTSMHSQHFPEKLDKIYFVSK